MNIKEWFIEKVQNLDTTKNYWATTLLDELPNCYAKGYLNANIINWNDKGFRFDEILKENILEWCEHDIWD